MKIILIGSQGRMGKEMQVFLSQNGVQYCPVDKDNVNDLGNMTGDVVLDFSSASALEQNLTFAKKRNLPIVIATTNHTKENIDTIKNQSKYLPIFMSSNFSIMFNLLNRMIGNIKKQTNQEVVLEEIHHKTKKDIPSGSAKMLIATLKRNNVVPKVVALRVGKVIGTHKVKIYGDFETLTLTHNVENRQVFCLGAYKACKFILSKKCGLYNMENLIDCM